MIVKTKYYRLEKKVYRKLVFKTLLRKQWWAALIAVAVCSGYLWIPTMWWIIGAWTGLGLYFLFWWIQFYGVTYLEQGKMLFERFSYELNSRQVIAKLNSKEGMPINWEQIKRAYIGKDYFLLMMSKVQIIHLPFKIFNSENERKFLKSILKTKNLIP